MYGHHALLTNLPSRLPLLTPLCPPPDLTALFFYMYIDSVKMANLGNLHGACGLR